MKNKAHERKNASSRGGILFCVALGSLSTIIILFVLLALFSCVTVNMKNPHAYLTALSFFAVYASAFFGGFIATKKNSGRDALTCGSLTGVASAIILCLLFLAIGAIFKTQSSPLSWLFRALTVVFSLIGALLATKKKSTPKNIRKRRRK